MSPLEFECETIQKARKQYECECCNRLIEVGEKYARCSPAVYGDHILRKLCLTCNDVVTAFCSESDKDFNYDDIRGAV